MNGEMGFALCEAPDGSIAQGPLAWGGVDAVTIPIDCPFGMKPFGTLHTHPGGLPIPSGDDIAEGLRLGLQWQCLVVEGSQGVVCHSLLDNTVMIY